MNKGSVGVLALCSALSVGIVQAAEASTITLQTRDSAGNGIQSSAAAYKSVIDGLTASAPTSGYCDAVISVWTTISNQNTCPAGANGSIALHFSASFAVSAAQTGTWDFRFSPDVGLGGAFFLDGAALDFKNYDIWDTTFTNPAQYLFGSAMLAAGIHVVDVYGIEGCCDGPGSGQFRTPSGAFTPFSTNDNMTPAPVPEPASLLLLGTGLSGLAVAIRRRRAA